jgi:hypothetical protein
VSITSRGSLVFNLAGTFVVTDRSGNLLSTPAGWLSDGTNKELGFGSMRTTDDGYIATSYGNFGATQDRLAIFSPTPAQTFATNFGNEADCRVGVALGTNTLYYNREHPALTKTLHKIDKTTGADVATWVLGTPSNDDRGTTVSPSGSLAYIVHHNGNIIYTFDLVGAGGLVAWKTSTLSDHSEIVALRNGHVLVDYDDGTDVWVLELSTAAAELNRWHVGTSGSGSIIALTEDLDDLSFWVSYYDFVGLTVTFQNIRISDGAIVHSFSKATGGTPDWVDSRMVVLRVDIGASTFTPPPATPPSVPTVSCKPTTTVLTSPAHSAGCNQGGTGWTPTFTGTSGSVPVGADPVVGETLTGKPGVHVWAEITNTIYPAGTVTETLRYAMTDLDDATRKEGRLLSIGDVEFSLSDAQGNMQAGTIDIQISDVNGRPIGTRLVDSTKKYIARNEIAVFCISTAGRRALVRPKRVGRALLTDDRYSAAAMKFSGIDPFFQDGGAFGPDKKVPMWTIPAYYVNAPMDVYAKPLPIIIGEVSDEGATDPATNLPNSRGLCPLTFVGIDPLGTGPGGAAENWGRFNVCLFAAYAIVGLYGADLSADLYGIGNAVSDGANPSVITLGGSPDLSTIVAKLAAAATAGTTDDSLMLTLFTGLHGGVVKAQITAADDTAKTVTISATVAVGDTVGFATLAGLAAGVDWLIGEDPQTRVKLDLVTRNGKDCMVFGYPNYIRTTTYEDIMGSDGEIYRVQDIWVRGPLLDAHLNGQVTLAANVIGVEDQGDGTGLPITDYFTAYNWFIENCVIVNSKIPKGPGSLFPQTDGDLAAYADGTYMVKGSTFVAAQAASAIDFGGDGYKVGAYFGDPISTRDAIQLWNDNGGCRLGVNEDGQIFVWRLDRTVDTTTWPRVEHVNRVFGEVARTHPSTEVENVVQGTCDWDADGARYRNPLTVFTSTTGILHNKSIRKNSKLIDGKLTRDPLQWNYVLQQRLAYAQDGPVYVTFTGDIGLMDYGIGSGIQFTSIMGPGSVGYVDQPLIILSKRYMVDSHLVTLFCLDVGSGAGTGLIVAPTSAFTLDNESSSPRALGDETAVPSTALVLM